MLELTRSPNNYILTFEDGQYILCVSLNGFDTSEIKYVMNAGEIYTYESQKEPYLELLSRQVRQNAAMQSDSSET